MPQLAAFALFLAAASVVAAPPPAIPGSCRQIVRVVAPDWTSPQARLQCLTRSGPDEPWQKAGPECDVRVGRQGLAWGLGRHAVPRGATRRKREGDRCAPAGIFAITGAFGLLVRASEAPHLPFVTVTDDLEAIDDPASRFYNRLVRRSETAAPDWHSAEQMARIKDYALGLIVAHNAERLTGAGSCIFIHEWRAGRAGSSGCTLLRAADLRRLAGWLDSAAQPLLVQAPAAEMAAWGL